MDAPLDYGFVSKRPNQRPPDLSRGQVRDLSCYIEALAVVRDEQLKDLGLDADRVHFLHSPEGLRGIARFMRDLYPPPHTEDLDDL